MDQKTRRKLRKLGVTSADDLKQLERKNVDITKVSDGGGLDYRKLAQQIEKSRRGQNPPRVNSAVLSMDENRSPYLLIRGNNLSVDPLFPPVAVVNDRLAEVLSASETEMSIAIKDEHRFSASNEVILTVDPFAVLKINVNT